MGPNGQAAAHKPKPTTHTKRWGNAHQHWTLEL